MTTIDNTTRLTSGQKTWLAVGLAKTHQLSIATGIALADTVAELLPSLPADYTRRCQCGEPIGPDQQWCSPLCYRADEGHEREHELDEAV